MPTARRPRFRYSDLTRAWKATKAAGVEISHIRIEPEGSILIVPGKPPSLDAAGDDPGDAYWLERLEADLGAKADRPRAPRKPPRRRKPSKLPEDGPG